MASPNRPNIAPLQTGIGVPSDGTYTDGLLQDLTPQTSTADAVAEINEVLKQLAPAPAPPISSIALTMPIGNVAGMMSYDAAHPWSDYSPVNGVGNASGVDADGLFDAQGASGSRRGITAVVSGIGGTLANNTAADSATPTPSYPAEAFGPGDQGTLYLEVNGTTIATADLTALGAINQAPTGFVLSAATAASWPNGNAFNQERYRTGTFQIAPSAFRHGWNYIRVRHVVGSNEYASQYVDFVWDADTTATAFSSESLSSLAMSGAHWLSGVKYHTAGQATYALTVSNAYRTTYALPSQISYNVSASLQTPLHDNLPICNGNPNATDAISKTVFLASGIRLINGGISVSTNVARSVQDDLSSPGASIAHLLVDSVSDSDGVEQESFTGEAYRLTSNAGFDNAATDANWDSTVSLASATNGYSDGLQVSNGQLIYPSRNWGAITNGPTGNPNYSSCSGSRYFYRVFKPADGKTHANFVLTIQGNGVTFIPAASSFTNVGQIKVELKVPTQTGWMDAYADFQTAQFGDGAGARYATYGLGRALNTPWGLSIGTQNTAHSGNRIFLRVTVPQGFSGYLTSINFHFI